MLRRLALQRFLQAVVGLPRQLLPPGAVRVNQLLRLLRIVQHTLRVRQLRKYQRRVVRVVQGIVEVAGGVRLNAEHLHGDLQALAVTTAIDI